MSLFNRQLYSSLFCKRPDVLFPLVNVPLLHSPLAYEGPKLASIPTGKKLGRQLLVDRLGFSHFVY